MKTIKNALLTGALAILVGMTVTSCQKEDLPPVVPTNETSEVVSIDSLKTYLSELVQVEKLKIGYNEKTKMFSILDIDQVSLEDLTKYYLTSKQNPGVKYY